nr:MAG TPA: Minor capsid protein [Bacteriophage sp.]
MALKFSVHTDGMDAVKEAIANACSKAEHNIAVEVKKDTAPFVPARNKMLDKGTRVVGNMVVYPGPYARYLYYGKLWLDPLTGSSWVKHGEHKAPTNIDLKFNQAVHKQAQSHWFEASKAQNIEKWVRVAEKAVKRDL